MKLKNPSTLPDYQWQFLKQRVRGCIQNDLQHVSGSDLEYCLGLNNNQTIHNIALQFVDSRPFVDQFGGFVLGDLILREHGGLFQLSLDRITNKRDGVYCIHFPDPADVFANIRTVSLCVNVTAFNITLEQVQARVHKIFLEMELKHRLCVLLKYESKISRKRHDRIGRRDTTLYSCVHSIFNRDKKAAEYFKTRHIMWEWALAHLAQIGGRCEISNIPLETNRPPSMWQMSIDAIDPIKGHIPGNMRIVCRFLNCANFCKVKTYDDPSDGPNSWTPELFCKYFRIWT
jgi:hypothetical protein